ncbi:cobalt-precorrin 5A hydrolase [Lutispora thermophila]|uniref:Cobalt-precorrin 5A acetaldehyde-lyase n=1 Tax=Lutispora thermophila DSM 19022 TaxID=1122184 RepID=A0A1M6D3I2_9FIRM|nr:cobalt-precorrin 5A hydrolase [Lutispora thermophila]SHI67817.1 cobalt-precorrin 5A acetaldehyde-lyase [Lutispora thermophila DSM 19022]
MKTAVIAITKKGIELAKRIGGSMKADVFVKNDTFDKVVENGSPVPRKPLAADFKNVMEKLFNDYEALICIMACGIVVRSIAPYLKSKQLDPAVVVVDELGRFAISLISGHIGGANRLAEKVAAAIGAAPVITTATDINRVVAFDELALMNNCAIENIGNLKYISSELVNGGKICLLSHCKLKGVLPNNIELYDPEHSYEAAVILSNQRETPVIAEKILYLRPKNLIIGIGCKRGKTRQEIKNAVMDFMTKSGKSLLSVRCIASINLKSEEKGINEFSKEMRIPFKTFSVDEIKRIEYQFFCSDFVRKTTGVGNVAEACAVLAGTDAKLIYPKTVYDGITLALAEEELEVYLKC